MYKIDISTSGGWSLEATTHEDYEFYRKAAFHVTPCEIQKDIFALGINRNIAGFKDKWQIYKIHHLSLGPCGLHQFTIEDDKFTFQLGLTLEEQEGTWEYAEKQKRLKTESGSTS